MTDEDLAKAIETAELKDFIDALPDKLNTVVSERGSSLSGGQKKLLELGRALMAKPLLVLLDEPVAGVNPVLAEQIASRVRKLRADGYTFLIIEHNMEFIMGLADRLYVMANGRILREGSPADVRTDRAVLDAYLGVE